MGRKHTHTHVRIEKMTTKQKKLPSSFLLPPVWLSGGGGNVGPFFFSCVLPWVRAGGVLVCVCFFLFYPVPATYVYTGSTRVVECRLCGGGGGGHDYVATMWWRDDNRHSYDMYLVYITRYLVGIVGASCCARAINRNTHEWVQLYELLRIIHTGVVLIVSTHTCAVPYDTRYAYSYGLSLSCFYVGEVDVPSKGDFVRIIYSYEWL